MSNEDKIFFNEVFPSESVSKGEVKSELKPNNEQKKIINKINKIKAEIKVLEDILSELETEYRIAEIEQRGTKAIEVKVIAINKIIEKIDKRKENINKIEKDLEVKN